ncbi:uncharacterized protein [Miscanthus floridulus]|uniref:uncharacterized protein isoform X2 n=1 Tax=Miscanthus floridulus TaxID=154761 RepID=UPI00345B3461
MAVHLMMEDANNSFATAYSGERLSTVCMMIHCFSARYDRRGRKRSCGTASPAARSLPLCSPHSCHRAYSPAYIMLASG